MAQKMSTGLCNALLDSGSFKDIFDGGFIHIYDQAPPLTADAAQTDIPVCIVSVNSLGTGLTWGPTAGVSTPGVIGKAVGELWTGLIAVAGVASDLIATHYRVVAAGDTGAASTTEKRIQGSIGTGGADMNLGSTELADGATFTLSYATEAFVPS